MDCDLYCSIWQMGGETEAQRSKSFAYIWLMVDQEFYKSLYYPLHYTAIIRYATLTASLYNL